MTLDDDDDRRGGQDEAMESEPRDTAPKAAEVRALVVIVGSAGAISVLRRVVAGLRPEINAAIVIVQHRSAEVPSVLAHILRRASRVRVEPASDGVRLEPGTIYVAPPDRHVIVTRDRTLRLVNGHRIRGVLSSANPLFETASLVFGERLLAIVLTGYDHDGTDGVQSVAAAGGTVVVQEPETAFAPAMPSSAIATGAASAALPVDAIAGEIQRFVERCG